MCVCVCVWSLGYWKQGLGQNFCHLVTGHGQLNLLLPVLISSLLICMVSLMYWMLSLYDERTIDHLLTLLFSVFPSKNFF